MIKNYLKVAFRNLMRHKVYSFINIAGLAIGMTCCLLILLFVRNELRYEQFHENKDQIYRVAAQLNLGSKVDKVAALMPPLAPMLAEEYPEVLNAVRFNPSQDALVVYGENRFKEKNFFFVDPEVFDVFTFPLVKGDPETALKDPFSLVITEETAKKYFGQENPVGKTLSYEDQYDLLITGVLQEIPGQTQLRCELMASFSSLDKIKGEPWQQWGRFGDAYTYIQLTKGSSPTELEQKLPESFKNHAGERLSSMVKLSLQPLSKIYLHSDLMLELEPSGNIGYVYLFSALAAAILLIACINFMNLATARSAHRSREVGMRKVFGAFRPQLIRQFTGESIVLSFIALLFAVVLFELSRPGFNTFLEKKMAAGYLQSLWVIPGLIGLGILVGFLAGSYPAVFLSKSKPITILKSQSQSLSGSRFRKYLVVFQFSISIALIIATAFIYNQLNFVKNEHLGFDKEQVIGILLNRPETRQQYRSLKEGLLQNPRVLSVSGAFSVPGRGSIMKTGVRAEGIPEDEPLIMMAVPVDFEYIKTLGIKIVEGRDFSREYATDASEAFILNQAAIKRLGWENPIGKQFSLPTGPQHGDVKSGKVIGVVRDFHMRSLRERIEPLFLHIDPERFISLAVRIRPGGMPETIDAVQSTWEKFVTKTPFEYSFVEESFAILYRTEERLGQTVTAFSLLAVFIACLGLFGLASFTAEQRNKEVGIRKVLGASVSGLVMLLSKDFLKLVLIANIFAFPVAYYAINNWLQGFAYRINIHVSPFVFAGAAALLIALVTVSFQAIKAAKANPVDALKYE